MTAANKPRLDDLRALAGMAMRQSAVTIDQLVFSMITFAVQLIAAPVSTNAEYGIFSLIALVQIGQWYLGRAVAAEPLLVSKVAAKGDTHGIRGAAATSLLVGITIGIACLFTGMLLDGPARTLLLIQALASPFTAVLDHSRYVSYARQRASQALILDGLWLALFLGAVGLVTLMGKLSTSSTYLLWALSAVPVAAVGAWLTGGPFAVGAVRGWLRDQQALLPGFLIDAVYLTAGTWATFGVTAWIVGLDGLGLLRKALVPVTALIVLFIGISNALLTHLAGRSAREVVRAPMLISCLAAVVSLVFAGLVLIAPANLLTTALGTSWDELRPVVLVLLAYAFLLATAQTALIGGKASGHAWLGPRVRTVQFIAETALAAILGLLLGVIGVALGMALAWVIGAALAWGSLLGNRARA